jgi:hypothetical protein
MPKSALPPNYVIGPDNQSWLMRLKKTVQIWLAAGPRVTPSSSFFNWREIPITLFASKGKGYWRYENTDGTVIRTNYDYPEDARPANIPMYLSRIQPWCRWHISLQWPLFFNCHCIYRAKDVVICPVYQSDFGIKKMFTFGIGFKRDSDKVYWCTSNIGGNFE